MISVPYNYNIFVNLFLEENRTAFDMRTYADRITGLPDGMTIDEDDNIYVALYGGGAVIKINPRTAELLRVSCRQKLL